MTALSENFNCNCRIANVAPPVGPELGVQRVCEDVEVPQQPEQAERGAAAPADRGVEGDTPAQCRGHTAATPCADTHHRQEEARGHRSRMVTWSASPLAPVSPHLRGLNIWLWNMFVSTPLTLISLQLLHCT